MIRQRGWGFDQTIHTRCDVRGPNPVAVAIQEDAERDGSGFPVEPQANGGSTPNRLHAGEAQTASEIPCRGVAPGVIRRREHLRGGDATEYGDDGHDRHQLDQRVAVPVRRPRTPALAACPGDDRYSDFGATTVMSGFIFRKLFSPM